MVVKGRKKGQWVVFFQEEPGAWIHRIGRTFLTESTAISHAETLPKSYNLIEVGFEKSVVSHVVTIQNHRKGIGRRVHVRGRGL